MKPIALFLMLALGQSVANAQVNSFEQYRNKRNKEFTQFREKSKKDYEDFRRKRNREFAEFVRKRWEAFEAMKGTPKPKEEDVPPIYFENDKEMPPAPAPLPFDEVVTIPAPPPQPAPIEPIEEVPIDTKPVRNVPKEEPVVVKEHLRNFAFFGNVLQVRLDKSKQFRLAGVNESAIADAWMKLSEPAYTNLIHDCLSIRKQLALCDWAYLMMLQEMANTLCGKNTNEAVMLMAYVYCQSGYKMRLARTNERLYMLYASRHGIYDKSYYVIDGERFYTLGTANGQMYICEAVYPKEQSMSLQIPRAMALAWEPGNTRTLQSKRYPELSVQAVCNKNMIDFYSTYPTSELDNNFMTRWAMYANSPLEDGVSKKLYPALRRHISGLSKKEAVERLLNWVQTAFVYEYDDKVWGDDRAFFPEETLYYPFCDCEDRSILFTRLVRDLLGLDCVLVYYPGHLASAVCFGSETVNGDYIALEGKRFIVCDPTYIGASVGRTMPDMNNAQAKVILLD